MSQSKTGEKIKGLRIQSGISQEELSQSTQLSLRTIQRIENGETEPRGDSLKRIANALNITVEELTVEKAEELAKIHLKGDESILTLIQISAFGYLLYPFLGVIFPMLLWIFYRDKVIDANKIGRKVMKFQSVWCALIVLFYLYGVVAKLNHTSLPIISNRTAIICIICLYILNAIVILFHLYKLTVNKKLIADYQGIFKVQ